MEIIIAMLNSIKNHLPNLATILLVLMLGLPFGLYYFAQAGSNAGVMISLAAMALVMLVAMKK